MASGALRTNKWFARAGGQAIAPMSGCGGLGCHSGGNEGVGAGGGWGTLTTSLLWELS